MIEEVEAWRTGGRGGLPVTEFRKRRAGPATYADRSAIVQGALRCGVQRLSFSLLNPAFAGAAATPSGIGLVRFAYVPAFRPWRTPAG